MRTVRSTCVKCKSVPDNLDHLQLGLFPASQGVKIVSPGAAIIILKGLVSSSVHWIVSEYIMKVPESLVNVWEVRRERPDKDIARLTDSPEVATVSRRAASGADSLLCHGILWGSRHHYA